MPSTTEVAQLIDYVRITGRELVQKQGTLKDIGVTKRWLTEEDLRIERDLQRIISGLQGTHEFYSEEEHATFMAGESVWIADPISGTKLFLEGKPHYAIVIAHMTEGSVDFATVYDPTDDSLYLADESGAYLNGKTLERDSATDGKRVIFAPSYGWADSNSRDALMYLLERDFQVFPSQGSMALNYCLVAGGEFDGVVSLTKDAFPEFAGLFIANKSGATATNIHKETDIHPEDRVFICARTHTLYEDLFEKTKSALYH